MRERWLWCEEARRTLLGRSLMTPALVSRLFKSIAATSAKNWAFQGPGSCTALRCVGTSGTEGISSKQPQSDAQIAVLHFKACEAIKQCWLNGFFISR